ncbi:MAG TPA: pyruvate dehydrogenase complex dihydrolipoamide acetyltransferase [Alphaproteobacteria bacterium]
MPIKILMPALSPTMTEGNLAKWHKKEGDKVSAGDVIAEIETDKATMEVEAVDEGTLGRILVPEGTQGVAVNQPIALLLEEGEDRAALDSVKLDAPSAPPPGAPSPTPTPAASAAPQAPAAAAAAQQAAAPTPRPAPTPPPPAAAAPTPARGNGHVRIFASPLARRIAQQAGIDLSTIVGSGPHGRVVKADVESAIARGPAPMRAPAAPPSAPPAGVPGEAYTDIPHTGIRRIIAARLVEAKQTIPHIYLTIDCEIDRLLAARQEINDNAPEGEDGYKVSVNDMIIKAAALALRKVPAVNASWLDNAIRRYNTVDIAVAVAIPDGLITPIVRNADQKGIAAISREMKDFVARAKARKLMPEEYQGGGFSISNLGMYGIKDFAAVINPPHAAILAVGAGEQRPVVKGGKIEIATVMSCTLSSDHRIVDGALAAEFLQVFKKLVEAPATMLA